jgi:hypothetical protein
MGASPYLSLRLGKVQQRGLAALPQGDYYYVSTIKESSYDPVCQKSLKVGLELFLLRGGMSLPCLAALSSLPPHGTAQQGPQGPGVAWAVRWQERQVLRRRSFQLCNPQLAATSPLYSVAGFWQCLPKVLPLAPCMQVVAGQVGQGLQNATCTSADALLYSFYSPDDPLPKAGEPCFG